MDLGNGTGSRGLTFTQAADVVVGSGRHWIGNAIVREGLLRYYGSGMGGVWSATSSDGAAWSLDASTRLPAAGDAAAVVLSSDETLLVAVGPPRADAGPSPFGP